jgi:hypothetical protein
MIFQSLKVCPRNAAKPELLAFSCIYEAAAFPLKDCTRNEETSKVVIIDLHI